MTKAEAKAYREKYSTERNQMYFSSKTGTMSIRVYTYINNEYDEKDENERISKWLERVKEEPFKHSIKRRTYQGFIHDTCIIAE
jgi:hypothetical protein